MFMSIPNTSAILGSIIPLLILDVIVVALRFYVRRKRNQPFQADDWLTIPSFILTFGLGSIIFYGIGSKTLGYPAPPVDQMRARSEVTASDWTIVMSRKLEYSFLCIFASTNGLVKLSVLFLYRRIFVVDYHWKNARNLFFLTLITIIALWSISYTFAFMFMCGGKFEILFTDLLAAAVKCADTFKIGYSCSISDFLGDVLIILIPIPLVWKLRLPFTTRLAVMSAFLIGILASGASLIRMLWMIWANHVGMDPTMDEELLLTSELYWCMMEITLGLLASCLPTLRALFKSGSLNSAVKNVRSLFSLRSGSSSSRVGISPDPRKQSRSMSPTESKASNDQREQLV